MTSVYSNPKISTTLIDRCLDTRTAPHIDCFIPEYWFLRHATKITASNKNCTTNMITGQVCHLSINVTVDLCGSWPSQSNRNTELTSICRYRQVSTLTLILTKNPNPRMRKLRAHRAPCRANLQHQLLLPVNTRTISSQPNTKTQLNRRTKTETHNTTKPNQFPSPLEKIQVTYEQGAICAHYVLQKNLAAIERKTYTRALATSKPN